MNGCGRADISCSTCFSVIACATDVLPRSSRCSFRSTFIAYSWPVSFFVAIITLPNSPSPTSPWIEKSSSATLKKLPSASGALVELSLRVSE